MANEIIDNNIIKAAAVPAKKQKTRRIGAIIGTITALFFIVVLAALSINCIVSLASENYKLTSTNVAFNVVLSFLQSVAGLVFMLIGIALIIAVWVLAGHILRTQENKRYTVAALVKAQEALSKVSLRYDNIHEITAVLDVLDMITQYPKTKKGRAEVAARLNAFIKAENITLPQTPEIAAILDSLPAPDTPSSLAAALSSGATLRQAEDGQTLVLTTISGGKNILLTPVQTADGIILCQQGARIKADLAPNLEDIGISSMPASPEFFEGLPLEKNVAYPELPEPHRFGPEMLSGGAATSVPLSNSTGMLSAPTPTANAGYAALDHHVELLDQGAHEPAEIPAPAPHIDLAEKPATPKTAAKAQSKPKGKKQETVKVLTTAEQEAKKQKAKDAAAKRKAQKEALLAAMSPTEREAYLEAQKQKRIKQAETRKKKVATDPKKSKN